MGSSSNPRPEERWFLEILRRLQTSKRCDEEGCLPTTANRRRHRLLTRCFLFFDA